MRTLIAGIAVLLSLSLGTSAQDSNAQIKAAVRDVLVRQQDDWNRHDLEAFMSGYWNSPDLTFFSGANVTNGWKDTLARYRTRYLSEGHELGQLQFSDLEITPLG